MHVSTVDPRYCPLCDAPVQGPWCARHRVPSIHADGPREPLERLEVGTELLGRYRVEGLLQQGGMGVLLQGTRLSDRRTIVIKVLKGQRLNDMANMRRFYQEARVACALKHPNIVRMLEFGVDEATRAPFLAMELVIGRTLKALVAEEGPLSEMRTAGLFAQLTRALACAHAQAVLHRDLKPSNIMVRPGLHPIEQVQVLDFGLAKIVGDEGIAPLTLPGKTVGTPAFMSPEQVSQRPQDFRSDLYGLGCVLYATLTGGPPFVGEGLVDVMRMQLKTPAPRLPERLSDGRAPSETLIRLYRALMHKDPNARPGSTDDVAEVFERLAGEPAKAPQLAATLAHVETVAAPETLPDPVMGFDTEPSLDSASLPSATDDLWLDEDSAGSGSNEARTTIDQPGIIEARMPSTEGPSGDLETPLVQTTIEDSSDEILTTVVPQGLDDASNPETGPVLGASLLVPRPWPSAVDLKETLPLQEVYPATSNEAVTVEPSPTRPARPQAAPDPAERAPLPRSSRRHRAMFVTLGLAVVLVGLAAGAWWMGPRPRGPMPTHTPVKTVQTPSAQPRGDPGLGLRLETVPDGAQVRVQGKLRGTSPLWLPRPAPGKEVTVDVRKEGYEPKVLRLGAKQPTVVQVRLERRP